MNKPIETSIKKSKKKLAEIGNNQHDNLSKNRTTFVMIT